MQEKLAKARERAQILENVELQIGIAKGIIGKLSTVFTFQTNQEGEF